MASYLDLCSMRLPRSTCHRLDASKSIFVDYTRCLFIESSYNGFARALEATHEIEVPIGV